jgi:hypothetical protein
VIASASLALLVAGASAAPATPAAAAAALPFACPPGAERTGAEPPDGFEVACERPDQPEGRRRQGPARTYYDDGGLAKEERFKEGKLDGFFTEWHRNGRVAREGAWSDGARTGAWRIYYEDGQLEEDCSYDGRGERHGRFAAYWPSGKRKVEGRFCHGLQCGNWTTWDEGGREMGRVAYGEIRGEP